MVNVVRFSVFIIVVSCFIASPIVAQQHIQPSDDELNVHHNPIQCFICERNCARYNIEPGERYCLNVNDPIEELPADAITLTTDTSEQVSDQSVDNDDRNKNDEATAVSWTYEPTIESLWTSEYLPVRDVAQSIDASLPEIKQCYTPDDYHHENLLEATLTISYSGSVQAISAIATAIQPIQARCMLTQLWMLDIPNPPKIRDIHILVLQIHFVRVRTTDQI